MQIHIMAGSRDDGRPQTSLRAVIRALRGRQGCRAHAVGAAFRSLCRTEQEILLAIDQQDRDIDAACKI